MQSKELNIHLFHERAWEERSVSVVAEKAVTLTVNNEPWLEFMCTPSDLEALAVGFLFNEGIVENLAEVAHVRVCPEADNIDVWLNHSVQKPIHWTRTSGCSGGKTSVERNRGQLSEVIPKNGFLLPAEKVRDLLGQLNDIQELYQKTGGVHTSAMSDGEKIILVVEDIGRHNTLDKLAGKLLLEQIDLSKKIILTTGRISSEMIQKAGRMKAAVVISRTSPTSLSVQMAEAAGITLVGYARGNGFSIYSNPERILSISIGKSIKGEKA